MSIHPPSPSLSRSRPQTPQDYFDQLPPEIQHSFSAEQQLAIATLLESAIPKPSPKLVDLRFGVDLILTRFYVVLWVGRDRRHQRRSHPVESKVAQLGNLLAASVLLIGLNLTLSAFILLVLYLGKSALGIDTLPGHVSETIKRILKL